MLKKNEYQEDIISIFFKTITNNHSLSQTQQKMQATEIRMSINLPNVEVTSEKLRRILRSHRIRSTFYTESTLRKLLCKPKDPVATEDKNNTIYESDCSSWETVYFNESKLSRIATVKRIKLQNTVGKQIIALARIRRKLLVDRESKLIPRKIEETIYSLKNHNHISKIS